MNSRILRRCSALGALALASLSLAASSLAQIPLRVTIPGSAFTLEGQSAQVDDVAGGRRFRGVGFATLTLRAVIPLPSSKSADPKVQRLVVHFRTSGATCRSGPCLESVKLQQSVINTNLMGDYTTSETTLPSAVANAWDWKSQPIRVGSGSVIRLVVQFPGGIDSKIDPGEFILKSIVVDFPRTAASFGSTTLSPRPRPTLAKP